MTLRHIKTALMIIGGLTIAGIVAMAGLFAYLWWDTQSMEIEEDFDEIEKDFEDVEAETQD